MVSAVAISIIALEFFIIKFIVSLLKLDQKYSKPKQVLALIVIETIAVLTSTNLLNKTPMIFAYMCLFLLVKVVGLWKMKKWVLYVYLFANMFSWYLSVTTLTKGKDITTLIATGILGSVLILLFYYLQVYLPNKKEFV
jgi:uncharacterized membrane protein (DUF2068 family)